MVAERRARSVDHIRRKLWLRQEITGIVKTVALPDPSVPKTTEEPDPELPLTVGATHDVSTLSELPVGCVVKNTFIDFNIADVELGRDSLKDPSESCPAAVFAVPGEVASTQNTIGTTAAEPAAFDLTSAARMFSTNEVPREFMESLGHILQRAPTPPPHDSHEGETVPVAAGQLAEQGDVAGAIGRMSPPPPLDDIDEPLDEDDSTPGTPEWSPKHCIMPAWPVQGALQMPGTSCSVQQEQMRPVPPSLQSPQSIPPTPHPSLPLLSPMQRAPEVQNILYRVAFRGGLDLRRGPSYGALRTGVTLRHNEIFAVSQELPGSDGRVYLRLADGRGWAFNDAALIPHDPSVMRGHWAPCAPAPPLPGPMTPSNPCCCPPSVSSASPTPTGALWDQSWEPCPASVTSATSVHWEPMAEPSTPPGGWGTIDEGEAEQKKSRRRRKRGGKKRRPKGRVAPSDLPIWAADQEVDEASEMEADESSGGADDGGDLSA